MVQILDRKSMDRYTVFKTNSTGILHYSHLLLLLLKQGVEEKKTIDEEP